MAIRPAAWKGCLDDLVARGLRAPVLAIIDGNAGLRRAVGEIWPLATRLKSRISAASSLGREPCVFTRRRNSSWSRSIVFVVRRVFHCAFGKRKNVNSSSPPSRRLVTTPGQRLAHAPSKAA